ATMLRIGVLMTGALFAGLTAARLVEAATPNPSPRPRPGPASNPRPTSPLNRTPR
ncbi:MAG: hypothetical protein QOI86_1773, partial [Actinomycetota bacterium]|nr:hypothetical protein [Actinomycetota bacterium]